MFITTAAIIKQRNFSEIIILISFIILYFYKQTCPHNYGNYEESIGHSLNLFVENYVRKLINSVLEF